MRRMAVTAQSLFNDYFLPLYPTEAARDLAAARTTDANPGKNRAIFVQLTDAARVFVDSSAGVFGKPLELDFSPASVHRLGAAVTRERRDAWMRADVGSPKSELFNVVVHGAAYLGECAVRAGGTWSARNPLWESVVRLQSRSGEGDLAVFHWWLKSLDDDAFDDHASGLRSVSARTWRSRKAPAICQFWRRRHACCPGSARASATTCSTNT